MSAALVPVFSSLPRTRLGLTLLAAITLHGAPATLVSPPAKETSNPTNPAPASPTGQSSPTPPPLDPELPLVAKFDTNGDHRLDATERQAAREYLAQHSPPPVPAPTAPGREPPPEPAPLEPVKPGEKVSPESVATFAGQPLYSPKLLRTVFVNFEDPDWEKELAEFSRTDVRVPAQVKLDGTDYPGVGVRFVRQRSPLGAGYKHTLELSLDYTVNGQGVKDTRTLTLVDAHTDPTFLRTMLYYKIAREYIPTPLASFVRVVINGEDWGIYTSVQPLDADFTNDQFDSPDGARWVSTGGNLAYLGESPEPYRQAYRLLSPEDPAAWQKLIKLCRVLNQTPREDFDFVVAPILDVNGALHFLALENALMNQDGYSGPTGSFGLYLDPHGVFHLVPQGAEASFRLVEAHEVEHGTRRRGGVSEGGGGRSGRRGGGGGGGESGGGGRASGGRSGGGGDSPGESPAVAAKVAQIEAEYKHKDFPRKSNTDFAMLLSYSFIDKADADFDRLVTRDEWLGFARAWFLAMDEDFVGQITHAQFIAKVRAVITPTSMTDGHSRQTFGHEDPAGSIGENLFTAIDANHDGKLTAEEFNTAFAGWFDRWVDPKTKRLTEDSVRQGLGTVLTKTVFQEDQTFIAAKPMIKPDEGAEPEGRGGQGGGRQGARGGEGGGGGGPNGGTGLSMGPINLGLGGRHGSRDSGGGGSSVVTFGEQLDPLSWFTADVKPLQAHLLSMPVLKDRYLIYVHDIANNWLTWTQLGPIAEEYHALIAREVEKETHKPASYAHFVEDFNQDAAPDESDDDTPSLKSFIASRHHFLLESGDTNEGR